MLVTALEKQIKLPKNWQKMYSKNVLWITLLALGKIIKQRSIESRHEPHSIHLTSYLKKLQNFQLILIYLLYICHYEIQFYLYLLKTRSNEQMTQTFRKCTLLKQCSLCNLSIQFLSNALRSQR